MTRRPKPPAREVPDAEPRDSAVESPADDVRVTELSFNGEDFVVISMPKAHSHDEHALSEAESLVAEAILDGLSNAEIASQRGTSVRTIANQVAALFRKLGVASRAELVAHLEANRAGHSS